MSERYEIKAKLGEGGAGMVYRAWDTQLSRTVAIKRLFNPDGSEAGEKMRKDLLREASLLSSIQHPNICQVYDFGVDEDGGFVVMEFVNGENLEEASRRRIGLDEFCALAEQVLDGLSEAHQKNILHRDLKPSNVVINWLPNALFQVKILDFGLAKFSLVPAQQTIDQATHTAKGSVHSMAPEQFQHRPLDARTDLYSLGCLFYLLLTGQQPFVGRTMAEVMTNHLEHRLNAPLEHFRPDVPQELANWIGWLMSLDPANRPAGAVEALEALRERCQPGKGSSPALQTASPASEKTEPVQVDLPPAGPAPQPKTVPVFVRQPEATPEAASAPVERSTSASPRPAVPGAPITSSHHGRTLSGRWQRWLPFAVGAIVMALVVPLAWVWWHRSNPPPAISAATAPPAAPPPETSLPAQPNLLVWLDAAHGTRRALGTQPARDGDEVDHWNDRALSLGGNNAALYHTITNRTDLRGLVPKLQFRKDGGLSGQHPVIVFDGNRTRLVLGRGKGGVTGEPFHDLVRTDEFTCLAVGRALRAHSPRGRLIAARLGQEPNAWALSYGPDQAWHSGLPSPKAPAQSARVADAPGQFRILTCVWQKSADRFRFRAVKPDGSLVAPEVTLLGCQPPGPIREIRLGAHSQGSAEFFAGEVAEILLFNRALDDGELRQAEAYLLGKYFR